MKSHATFMHPAFGTTANPATGDDAFDPLAYCACPGRFRDVQRFARKRARRAMLRGQLGSRSGDAAATHGRLTREEREAIIDRAVEAFTDFYLHRDYAAAGIGADSPAVAALSAAAWMDRARWRNPDEATHGRGASPYPYHAAVDPAPDRIAMAAESVGVDAAVAAVAVVGAGINEGDRRRAVAVPGGPSGRGATDGRMQWHEAITREYVECRPGGAFCRGRVRELVTESVGRWRMKRGRGKARSLPPALAVDAPAAAAPRYTGSARPPAPVAGDRAGERCAVLHYAADAEAYRDKLADARHARPTDWRAEADAMAAAVARYRAFAGRRD
jgi:hypothetical protein